MAKLYKRKSILLHLDHCYVSIDLGFAKIDGHDLLKTYVLQKWWHHTHRNDDIIHIMTKEESSFLQNNSKQSLIRCLDF